MKIRWNPARWIRPDWQRFGRVLWQTAKRFEGMERRKEAAALTYTTLFALVPVLTVSYAILSAIPALQEWGADTNAQMLGYIMPSGSEMITDYLKEFSQQARKLTWIGILFLFITCLMLLRTIEMQFNRIWNVDSPRSRVQTFLRYWAVLSLGPVLFGAAIATTSLLASLPLWENTPTGWFTAFARALPWLFSVAAISVVYIIVPNCKVPVRHALAAALFVATMFEVGKLAFGSVIGLFPSYQLIYGAFAAVPLFLLWIYISWMLLLLGAELSYGLSHYRDPHSAHHPLQERLSVAQLLIRTREGKRFLSEQQLRRSLNHVDANELSSLLTEFRQRRWAMLSEDGLWAWVRDPATITLGEFYDAQTLRRMRQTDGQSESPLIQWQKELAEVTEDCLARPLSSLLEPQATKHR
ncbi:MAG TPA: hypothetical protein DEA26_03145 [Oceanospirillales bacterium]|nr:hypothetical protein [Oceanospirillaceae bacterium]HBS41650.1 hypothetical protein [Oceanospirillales bacterium]|tara:strand:- start:78368 stop:79603 length:1236 start_codon:yes stop_codon:yes gene_type:complete